MDAVDEVELSVVDAGSAEAQWAMAQYFAELVRRVSDEFDPGPALEEAANHYNPPQGLFVLATAHGATIGCGALDLLDDTTAEIKRMWVADERRGIGLGRRLLAHLEDEARRLGRTTVVLDTNGALIEAIAMYESCGYARTARYNDNPYAEHWFTKSLDPR